jgi:hypothetical protein
LIDGRLVVTQLMNSHPVRYFVDLRLEVGTVGTGVGKLVLFTFVFSTFYILLFFREPKNGMVNSTELEM